MRRRMEQLFTKAPSQTRQVRSHRAYWLKYGSSESEVRPALICVAPVPSQATTETPAVPGRSSGRSRRQVDYAALAGPRPYGKRGSSAARARQVLDLRAAGCRETQEALSQSAGVASSTVSRLHARDQKEAPPTPINHQIPLRLDDNSPTLMCMQEGPAEGETRSEAYNRWNRNYRRRMAVLRAAAVAAAAQATQVKECNH